MSLLRFVANPLGLEFLPRRPGAAQFVLRYAIGWPVIVVTQVAIWVLIIMVAALAGAVGVMLTEAVIRLLEVVLPILWGALTETNYN